MLNDSLSFLSPGDEVILHTVDDTGGDHEEIAVIWVAREDFLITANGHVLTNDSDFTVTPTGLSFKFFSHSSDAIKKYETMTNRTIFETFETVVE